MRTVLKTSTYCLSLLLFAACNSFDQKAFDEGFKLENPDYVIPTTVPDSETQFTQLLHGGESNQWTAQEFLLEGLFGTQSCRLDDTMTLNLDGTYKFDGGEMSCGGDDVTSKSGTYQIDYDNKKLIFDEGTVNEVKANVSGLDQGVISLDGTVSIFGVSMKINGIYTAE